MIVEMLKAKIHRATCTEARVDYVGSITVDSKLLEESGINEYEKVQVVNVTTGARIETYTICGEADSGVICLNGAAAHHFKAGDKVIIMSYCQMTNEEAKEFKPTVLFVNDNNQITRKCNYLKCGTLFDQE